MCGEVCSQDVVQETYYPEDSTHTPACPKGGCIFSSLAVFLIFLSSPTPFLHFSPKTNGPSPLYVLFPPSFQTHTVPVKLIPFSQSCTSTL